MVVIVTVHLAPFTAWREDRVYHDSWCGRRCTGQRWFFLIQVGTSRLVDQTGWGARLGGRSCRWGQCQLSRVLGQQRYGPRRAGVGRHGPGLLQAPCPFIPMGQVITSPIWERTRGALLIITTCRTLWAVMELDIQPLASQSFMPAAGQARPPGRLRNSTGTEAWSARCLASSARCGGHQPWFPGLSVAYWFSPGPSMECGQQGCLSPSRGKTVTGPEIHPAV